MPHRIAALHQFCNYFVEGMLFSIGLAWAGGEKIAAALVDRETMDQLRSADGALFGAAVIVVALWISKIADGKRMDKRHDEMIATLKESHAKSEALVAESIKAKLYMANSLDKLSAKLAARPCCTDENFLKDDKP